MNKQDTKFLKETYQKILKDVETKKEIDNEYVTWVRKRLKRFS